MRTERVTVLMTPAEKASVRERAAALGVSSGEVLRQASGRVESAGQEEELALLAREVELAVPRMKADLRAAVEAMQEGIRRFDAAFATADLANAA